MNKIILTLTIAFLFFACKKENNSKSVATPFVFLKVTVNNVSNSTLNFTNVTTNPTIALSFSDAIDTSTVSTNISFAGGSSIIQSKFSYTNHDSTLIIQSPVPLQTLSNYSVTISQHLKSKNLLTLKVNTYINLITVIDSTNKFPIISDSALLTLIQQQTFKYFWDFGDPVSGMARERNSDQTTAATGGTGFGIMSTIVAVNRNFITHADALNRISKIVNFLSDTTKVTKYHGAFSHWMNGATGATIPFGTQDNGGDIVETSYMMEGLLCARQFFNSSTDTNEVNLRKSINLLWNGVDWNWYRQNNQNALFWNWSPNYNWAINVQVGGWCEALITYVLAASSPTNSIPKIVYDNGWAHNGGMKNGNSYYGYKLPLGPDKGGPLFFEHYSFMGINPNGLSDAYAKYDSQTINHSKINYSFCVANPNNYYGYSGDCWGLTASDVPNGYNANEPNNDIGVISPTAAISSLPYAPVESMKAIRFFYYKLGDKIFKSYGFVDAFSLQTLWFANSFLAIDQGPQIVMIENYRTGLIWNLFTSCPEVKTGMTNLGFTAPYL